MVDIVFYPDELLIQQSEPVETFDGELAELTDEMIAALAPAKGIGLAAPQIGILKRFFVVHVPDRDPLVFVNPTITESSLDRFDYEEGCLSVPGVYAPVSRPSVITVSAYDAKGTPFVLTADGLMGRVIQHEKDHLEGVLFIDYLPSRRRSRLIEKYEKPLTQFWRE